MDRGLGAQVAHASRSADFAVVIGKREVESGTVTLKNLKTGEREEHETHSKVKFVLVPDNEVTDDMRRRGKKLPLTESHYQPVAVKKAV